MPKAIETKEVSLIRREAGGLVDTANELVVDNEDSAQDANELLVFVANGKRKLEEQRVFLVKPLNNHVKDINAKFKEWVRPLDEAWSVVQRKMLDFQREQEAIRVEALRLEQERVERLAEVPEGLLDDLIDNLPDLPVVAPRFTKGKQGSTAVRKTWTFEVTSELLLPRKYLMADEGVIGLAVAAVPSDPYRITFKSPPAENTHKDLGHFLASL